MFARPHAAVCRRQRYHYDTEADCKHNQHVKQIKQCVFPLQQMWSERSRGDVGLSETRAAHPDTAWHFFGSMPDVKRQEFPAGPIAFVYRVHGWAGGDMFRLWGPAYAYPDLRERWLLGWWRRRQKVA